MLKALISDFSKVLLFPKNESYQQSLNALHKELSPKPEYKALDHFRLNTELLDFYASLKPNLKIYLFTSDVIQDTPDFQPFLQPVFDRVFSASKLGIHKRSSEAYTVIINELGVSPSEVVFIDDDPMNLLAAQTAGLHTVQYSSTPNAIEAIKAQIT